MANVPKNPQGSEDKELANGGNPLLIDEFDIIELEDRLELAGRCNGRCDSPALDPS